MTRRLNAQQDVIRTIQPTISGVHAKLSTLSDDVGKMQKELKAVREHELCIICFAEPITMTIQPCGHRAFCERCVNDARVKLCPICRGEKINIQRIYSVTNS